MDHQHPEYKRLKMLSPHDLQPEVPSNDKDKEFHLTNSPRGIEVKESSVEKAGPWPCTLMPGGWHPVIELEIEILTTQIQEIG